jgi:hypothetical protein
MQTGRRNRGIFLSVMCCTCGSNLLSTVALCPIEFRADFRGPYMTGSDTSDKLTGKTGLTRGSVLARGTQLNPYTFITTNISQREDRLTVLVPPHLETIRPLH